MYLKTRNEERRTRSSSFNAILLVNRLMYSTRTQEQVDWITSKRVFGNQVELSVMEISRVLAFKQNNSNQLILR